MFMVIKLAFFAILRNKTRSLLTCIGIIVGIAAVISVMAVGKAASFLMVEQISTLGSNLVIIMPQTHHKGEVRGGIGQGVTLNAADAEAIAHQLSHLVSGVSPMVSIGCQVVRQNLNWNVKISGVSHTYPSIRNQDIAFGRFFDAEEQRLAKRVCVIGKTVRDNVFGEGANPVGQTIRIGDMPFKVIGMLEPKGANSVGQDQDDAVMAPYTTVGRVLTRSEFMSVDSVMLTVRESDELEDVKREIVLLLRQRHRLADYQDNDFEMRDTQEILNTMGSVMNVLTILLTCVAGISLLVGGIGIMNIMLVSVTERIKEIGLRMAIGARPSNILGQFLLESMVLSLVGGALGIALGAGLSGAISAVQKWPVAIDLKGGLFAVAFSAAIGVFFGFYPAYRASKLNPIDCLRHE